MTDEELKAKIVNKTYPFQHGFSGRITPNLRRSIELSVSGCQDWFTIKHVLMVAWPQLTNDDLAGWKVEDIEARFRIGKEIIKRRLQCIADTGR